MAFRESEVGKCGDLVVDILRGPAGNTVRSHTFIHPGPEAFDAFRRSFRPHRPPQLVGLGRREAGDIDRHLHELFLKNRYTEGLRQAAAQQRMRIGDLLGAVTAADVGMDRAALDRTRPNQRDLDHEIVETTWAQPRQRRHLGPALDLENPDGIGRAEHVVDRGILRWDRCEVERPAVMITNEIKHAVQHGQHTETQQVELDQPGRRTVVLVPLDDRSPGHSSPLHGHDLGHRTITDDHSAGMDTQVPGETQELPGQIHDLHRNFMIIR